MYRQTRSGLRRPCGRSAAAPCFRNCAGVGTDRSRKCRRGVSCAVYDVATPVSEGRIVFEDPRQQAVVMMPPIEEFTPYNGNNVVFDVKPGRILLFPAWLNHSVPPNRGRE